MTTPEVVSAYRRLYRTALQAVRYSTPARHQIRTAMRTGFRSQPLERFEPRRIVNTVKFLERAKTHTGMEHKILKNLLHVRYWQYYAKQDQRLVYQQTDLASEIRKNSWAQFDATLILLNESLDTCLW